MAYLFKNKYRIASSRLRTWNYSWPGLYFITICTKDKCPYFGEIENGEMQLSKLGKIAKIEWLKTVELRRDMNLHLGEFVVMPDHFHAIVMIGENNFNMNARNAKLCVSGESQNQYGPQKKNLPSVIRGFKSAVTTYARNNKFPFDWQPRYHDRIIRSSNDYHRISLYIKNNPANWWNNKLNRNHRDPDSWEIIKDR
ncbi:MAG: hypothetical protein IPN29_21735 [Saprospiraceae bacterium]|nr:hypothetical protein [Saprospiraceae bacterium]